MTAASRQGRRAAEAALNEVPAGISRSFIQHEVNRGKGAAVRTGCLAATGSYVAFIDADLASPPEDLLVLLAALDAGADLAVGVRNQGDGSDMRDRRGLARRVAGRFFSFAMRTLLLPDIGDSQCPLKAFKRSAAQRLFRLAAHRYLVLRCRAALSRLAPRPAGRKGARELARRRGFPPQAQPQERAGSVEPGPHPLAAPRRRRSDAGGGAEAGIAMTLI